MKHIIKKISLLASLALVSFAIGCTVPVKVTRPDGTQGTEYQLDPRVSSANEMISTIGGVVPPPYGWVLTSGAAIAGVIGTSIASYKNKREAAKNGEERDKALDVATTIIQGVESLGEEASKVKKAIADRAKSDGNATEVHNLVKSETA